MLRKRDYVYTRWRRRKRLPEGDGLEFLNFDTNTPRADRPPAKGFVRVNNFSCFAIVRDRPSTPPGGPAQCEFMLLSVENSRIPFPPTIVRWVVGKCIPRFVLGTYRSDLNEAPRAVCK